MIRELSVSGLGGIDSAVVQLGPGLNVITGETGTGKTMLLRGLSMIVGAKPDAAWVMAGKHEARVDCVVSVADAPLLRARAEQLGAQWDDDELIVSRVLGARTRAFIGGRPVPAATLVEFFDQHVTLHGQHDQRALALPSRQRKVVDQHAGPEHLAAVAAMGDLYDRARGLRADIDRLAQSHELDVERRTRAEELLRDVDRLEPGPGELASLRDELALLSALADSRQWLGTALAALDGTDTGEGATALLAVAERELGRLPEQSGVVAEVCASLASSRQQAQAAAAALRPLLESEESVLERIESLHERQRDLLAAVRRHGCVDLDDLIERARHAAELISSTSDAGRLATASAELADLERAFLSAAAAVFERRIESARLLAELVNEQLARLGLEHARFVARVEAAPAARSGVDSVAFELQTSRGGAVAIGSGASGGEMSRIALAVETALCASDPVACMVFDEVDAGVGGVTAHAVGAALARLAHHGQVILVTHLPQVAAHGDTHVRVARVGADTLVENLEAQQRIDELARMLGEVEGHRSAHALAADLLHEARRTVAPQH